MSPVNLFVESTSVVSSDSCPSSGGTLPVILLVWKDIDLSKTRAVSCAVWPIAVSVSVAGVTVIEVATGGGTGGGDGGSGAVGMVALSLPQAAASVNRATNMSV